MSLVHGSTTEPDVGRVRRRLAHPLRCHFRCADASAVAQDGSTAVLMSGGPGEVPDQVRSGRTGGNGWKGMHGGSGLRGHAPLAVVWRRVAKEQLQQPQRQLRGNRAAASWAGDGTRFQASRPGSDLHAWRVGRIPGRRQSRHNPLTRHRDQVLTPGGGGVPAAGEKAPAHEKSPCAQLWRCSAWRGTLPGLGFQGEGIWSEQPSLSAARTAPRSSPQSAGPQFSGYCLALSFGGFVRRDGSHWRTPER